MNNKGQYTAFEWQIIAGSVMLILVAILFLADSGTTGMATRTQPTEITLIEQNTTPILIEKPIVEKPAEVEGTIEEPMQIETEAGCVVPYENMIINSDTVFCKGTYYLNHSGKNNIKVRGDDIILDCNGSTIEGDFKTNFTTGISLIGERITLKNCNIQGYSTCVSLTNYGVTPAKLMEDSKIINNNFTRCDGLAGIFIDGQTNFNISNNRFVNFADYYERDIGSHAIYISSYNQFQSPQGGEFYSNYIYNMSASGVKINGYGTIRNIRIYNNIISSLKETQGDDYGVHIADAENILVYNNSFIGPYDAGVVLNIGTNNSRFANNNHIYDNTFTNMVSSVWSKSSTYNNKITNNYYSGSNLDFRITSLTNITIFDNDSLRIGYAYGQYLLYLTFTGNKNFTINSYNFTMYNGNSQWKPYNDVKNKSNGAILASNVDTFSIMLAPGQQIEVGDFVPDPVSNAPPVMDYVVLSQNLTCITSAYDVDNDSLTTTIEWYYNGTLNKTINSSVDVQNNMTGTHYCRARAYDGANYSSWMTSNTIIINATINQTINETINGTGNQTMNETAYIAPALSSIILSNDLNCSGTINKLSNITIDYYLDDSLNSTIALETNGSFIGYTQRFNGTWYCNVTASDGINTTSGISNTVIINETINQAINETGNQTSNQTINIPPIVTLSLNNSLTCNGTVNELVNMTILFYKNNAVNSIIVQQDINGTFSAMTNSSPGTWYCQVSATDGLNTTIAQSNTITISEPVIEEKPSRGGGGGGGGGSSIIKEEPVDKPKQDKPIKQDIETIDKKPQKALEEPVTEDTMPTIEEVAPIIVEEPKKITVWEKYWKIYVLWTIIFLVITFLLTRNKVEVKQDDKLNDYIIKSLQAGYSYSAIRRALKRQYKQTIIDQHFHILRRANLKPMKIKKIERYVPKERQKQAIISIKAYIVQQKKMGYKEKDVVNVLIQNGYPKTLIKEATKNA